MNLQFDDEVKLELDGVALDGHLTVPQQAEAIVIFSHGSGSSRQSPRNRAVSAALHEKQIGTLLFDLLTAEEDRQRDTRFDIDLLTQRLVAATAWLRGHEAARNVKIGYFGASTGAASALRAAAEQPEIAAVVSRGGRPDLAGSAALAAVHAPVLLLVGSLDRDVLRLNEEASKQLGGTARVAVIEGASHLFEEPGKLEEVAELAGQWFKDHLLY
jgi:putative phosphoribosyl transferase